MNRFEPTPERPGMTWTGFFHLLSKKESRTVWRLNTRTTPRALRLHTV